MQLIIATSLIVMFILIVVEQEFLHWEGITSKFKLEETGCLLIFLNIVISAGKNIPKWILLHIITCIIGWNCPAENWPIFNQSGHVHTERVTFRHDKQSTAQSTRTLGTVWRHFMQIPAYITMAFTKAAGVLLFLYYCSFTTYSSNPGIHFSRRYYI